MEEYHKIQTIFKRDPATKFKTLLMGEYSLPCFEYLCNNEWIFTEKVDGMNIRVMLTDFGLQFAGKTNRAELPQELESNLSNMFSEARLRKQFNGAECCLYGEGYGPKIHGGGKYRTDQGFVLFDVKVGNWWLERNSVEDIAKKLDLDIVPIIGTGTLNDMVKLCETGIKSYWGDFDAEGIVARPAVELKTRAGERIITKLKSKDFRSCAK